MSKYFSQRVRPGTTGILTAAFFFGLSLEMAPGRVRAQEEGQSGQKTTAPADARQLSLAFNLAAEKAMPSVVKILSVTRQADEENPILSILGGRDEEVFDSVGSGVIVSKGGLILTNHHVIQDATRVEVRLEDGRRYEVIDTKSDPRNDVAIIQIDSDEDLPVAELGKAENLYVGEWVLAIGSPFMLESSVSAGIISGTRRNRQLSGTVVGQFLQTDAAINPGNSGGPLIDLNGRVVGINTAISSRTGGFQGIGFAIPIERANWIKNELLEYNKVRRGYAGVRTSDVTYELIKQLALPRTGGALVNVVVPNYPAQLAGLKSGDVIIQFDGQVVENAADFAGLVQQSPIGSPLTLLVIRNEQQTELTIELIERPQ